MRRGLVRFVGPAILVLEIALVALLAIMVARIAWLVIEPGGAVSHSEPLVQSPHAATDQSRYALAGDPALLVRQNPFAEGVEPVVEVPEAPETKLNLVLKGVRASADGTGVAMIVMPNNRLHLFAPGDTVLDGVVLDRVYGDRVTLRKNGQLEALLMASGADRLSVLTSPGEPAPPKAAAAEVDNGTVSTTATDFLTNLAINPVHRGQDFVGYEISSRSDEAMLQRSGLRSGDIVLAVNGIPVTSTPPGELAMRLASEKKLSMRIDRDGRQIDQTFTLPENP